MYLFSLILGVVLLPEVYALECHQCFIGGSCRTQECPAGFQCTAMRVTAYAGDDKILDMTMKGCGPQDMCFQGSLNLGISKAAWTTKCCSTDLCNDQPAPDPSRSDPNGKKCFTCDGQQCTKTLKCLGNEDYCISTTGNRIKMPAKGCASQLISTSAGLLLLVMPLISLVLFS
uniref:UPAR/Ly6 domain-containing protein n=1 Tax=Salarias fasciatus TaxID=181472 RepID=A0A672HWU7_SALFA